MLDHSWIVEIIKTAATSLGVIGVVIGVLYGLFRKTLERTLERLVDSRFDERLEKIKHDLELEQRKMSIVFDQQKDSFRRVLVAMHRATHEIEKGIEPGSDEWAPILEKAVNAFWRVWTEENLFMDGGTDHALNLFRQTMWGAVRWEENEPHTNDVRLAYNRMNFIAEHLTEHFRTRVGLEPSVPDRLLDVEMLGACILLNRFHFRENELPKESPFRSEFKSAAQLIATVRNNPKLLRTELGRLRAVLSSKTSPIYFDALTQVDRYLGKLEALDPTSSL